MKLKALILSSVVLHAAASVHVAVAANFVANPNFDRSLANWTQTSDIGAACSWVPSAGSSSAGAASCIGAPPSGYTEISQCVAIPAARIDVSVRIKTATPGGGAIVFPQDVGQCSESPAGWELHDEGPADNADPDWHTYMVRFIPMDTPAVAIVLGSGGGIAYFDSVYAGPSETILKARFECDTDTYLDCQ